MRIVQLNHKETIYSCNSYLIRGDWNHIDDINTLVDVGTDGSITDELKVLSTGAGKNAVERVIVTHDHFDHTGGLPVIKKQYRPEVYAFINIDGTNNLLYDGQMLKLGDRYFEVIHTPGHSQDSICLYCAQERVLFSGDTSLEIIMPGGSYTEEFVNVLEKIARLDIDIIYSGHGNPITRDAGKVIEETLINVQKSMAAF